MYLNQDYESFFKRKICDFLHVSMLFEIKDFLNRQNSRHLKTSVPMRFMCM